jgi:hypothetical protein
MGRTALIDRNGASGKVAGGQRLLSAGEVSRPRFGFSRHELVLRDMRGESPPCAAGSWRRSGRDASRSMLLVEAARLCWAGVSPSTTPRSPADVIRKA